MERPNAALICDVASATHHEVPLLELVHGSITLTWRGRRDASGRLCGFYSRKGGHMYSSAAKAATCGSHPQGRTLAIINDPKLKQDSSISGQTTSQVTKMGCVLH